jgi:hypothetical protein
VGEYGNFVYSPILSRKTEGAMVEHVCMPDDLEESICGVVLVGNGYAFEQAREYYRRDELGKYVTCLLCCDEMRETLKQVA